MPQRWNPWNVGVANPALGGGSSTLAALTDVNVPAPNDNDSLTYDLASGKWVAEAVTGGSGLTHPQVLARTLGA